MVSAQLRARRRPDVWIPALLLVGAALGWSLSTRMAGDVGTGMDTAGVSMRGAAPMSFTAFVAAWVAMMAATVVDRDPRC